MAARSKSKVFFESISVGFFADMKATVGQIQNVIVNAWLMHIVDE